MSTSLRGFGFAPLGVTRFGYGAPATATATPNGLLVQPLDLSQGEARLIDPKTRDYVVDSLGRLSGADALQQRVQLAMMTVLGSSVVADLGIASPPDTINERTAAKIQDDVAAALRSLIKEGLIELQSVVVTRPTPTRISVTVSWRDLGRGVDRQTTV